MTLCQPQLPFRWGLSEMNKKNFWKSDWFLGLAVSSIVVISSSSDLLQSLERSNFHGQEYFQTYK